MFLSFFGFGILANFLFLTIPEPGFVVTSALWALSTRSIYRLGSTRHEPPVKLRVAPLVRVSRAIVEKIVA